MVQRLLKKKIYQLGIILKLMILYFLIVERKVF
ncbi:hypothetical protein N872_08590 [Neisseria meningitidis LNP27256]|uniref:Uncharacterized protein n=1 Tax=Neisseria meningitidis alpha153 TaxID=663926 RepID=C6SCB7_NEIME|nr:hypothetical protein N872_08590 [Neisseria meningitidis LNP27256]CBA05842.1 hypothetical protein predicted by Glimmer/Critica [Neisseria meningitidis alpha153]